MHEIRSSTEKKGAALTRGSGNLPGGLFKATWAQAGYKFINDGKMRSCF